MREPRRGLHLTCQGMLWERICSWILNLQWQRLAEAQEAGLARVVVEAVKVQITHFRVAEEVQVAVQAHREELS